MARGLADSFLRGEARAFFGAFFRDAEDRRRAVAEARRPLSPRVLDALIAQNRRLPTDPSRDAALEALGRGAVAVVTGQQVGLFLGPLYTLYKTASAIRLAHALTAETGHPAVPVFWLQTEDHDLPEIASCGLPGADGAVQSLSVPASPADRISIAHRPLPPELDACLSELTESFANRPHGEAHLARLKRHYRVGAGWSDAFAGLLAELFEGEGLVFVDPRDPALAQEAVPIHERAITDADRISEALLGRVRELEQEGFSAAVHVRARAPLSFFHPQGPEGPRYRLERIDGDFREIGRGRRHSPEALLAKLREEPLAFSTSALLRPILQDSLLPTAAYVGGPGEIAYFAQLAPLYELFNLPMPLIVPRARFRILESRTRRILERRRLTPDDAARPEDELLAACRGEAVSTDADALARRLLVPFEEALEKFTPELTQLDGGLPRAAEKARTHVKRSVLRLARKYERARLHADAALVADVKALKLLLQPDGAPQERIYGLPWFAARYGDRELVERVLREVDPLDPALKELSP